MPEPKTEVHIFCVKDFHAKICETEQTPGVAKLIIAVKQYLVEPLNTIVVFGGDNFRREFLSEECEGNPVISV